MRARAADGKLPRHIPIIAEPFQQGQRPGIALVTGIVLRDPCAVCDAGRTQLRYNVSTGSIAFQKRCHWIWTEEVGQRSELGGALLTEFRVGDIVIRSHRLLKTRGTVVRVAEQRRGEARLVWVKWHHADTLPNPSLERADSLKAVEGTSSPA